MMATELILRTYPSLLFAYHGHSLLITDRTGSITEGMQGLYEHDVRLLSRYRLLVHGRPPKLDALSAVDPYSTLGYYVCPPTADDGGGEAEHGRQVVIRVARFVGEGLHEDVEVANHGLTAARLDLAWELGADFADFVEVRGGGGMRQQEAPVAIHWQVVPTRQGELRFDYQHPQLSRGVVVRLLAPVSDGEGAEPERTGRADEAPLRWDGQRITYSLALKTTGKPSLLPHDGAGG